MNDFYFKGLNLPQFSFSRWICAKYNNISEHEGFGQNAK